jgi:superfamily II DNA or RNA helicase
MAFTALPLFPYQRQDLSALQAKLAEQHRVALVLPTGGGKTVCFAHQAMEWIDEHPDERVLILVDTDELVWQTRKRITDAAPHLSVGVVKAGRNEVDADVIVGSVQTLRNPARRKQIRRATLIIVDECEMAVTTSCMAILRDLGGFDGRAKVAGYTATLMRSDAKSLGLVWQDAVANRDLSWMIRHKWLINIVGKSIEVPDLDLAAVKATKADFKEGELGVALAESLAPQVVAAAILEHAKDRKTLMFVPTVASAYVFAEALEDAGIPAKVIHGGMGDAERADVLGWHRFGTVVVNCMLLTKGYDDVEIDCIAMCRPTKSKRLYIQMVGRGARKNPLLPWEDQECLLLDLAGASRFNDLRSIVDLSERPIKEPKDGASLTELEDEFDAGEGVPQDEPEWYTGDVVARDFDPLGRPSTRVWLKTAGGTFFMKAGTATYVFIMQYPAPGQWSVAQCPVNAGRPTMTEHRGLPLDQALVWAEDLARELGADLNTTDKKAPWRKKVASAKLATFARGLGLQVEGTTDETTGVFVPTERMGAVSDRVTVVLGTRRIDPIVKAARTR